ncbi:MAG: hypothetical protein JRG76_06005 [Deltaproteobacteria bacterium]|nr:hypothetical protein [Deltaproteobacteria bacterium]
MRAALAVMAVGLACTATPVGDGRNAREPDGIPTPRSAPATAYTMRDANRGAEPYSAWFADSDGRTVYFGLSPFWTLWWATDGDFAADLEQTGDLLIGRFDLATERFGAPLVLRDEGAGRTSVWDVLAHSSGRVCFTTYFDAMGCVDPATGEVQRFEAAGPGLNELVEGPGGDLYATRYSSQPLGEPAGSFGAVAVIGLDGRLLREHRLPNPPGGLTAPKSLAVDPATGHVWVNTDTFMADGSTVHETLELDAAGTVVSRQGGDPELHFPSFAPDGTGFFAETEAGSLYLRIVPPNANANATPLRLPLGPIAALDFVQDIKHGADGEVVLALWSGKLFIVRPDADGWTARAVSLQRLSECAAPESQSLVYSAFTFGDRVCATLFCGARIVCASQDEQGGEGRADHAQSRRHQGER